MNKSKTIINRFPKVVQDYIGQGFIKMISIGRNGDKVFQITSGNSFILKVSNDIYRLEHEKEIYEWLYNNHLPVPQVLFWYKSNTNNKGYLITKHIKGKKANDKYFINRPMKLINICVDAIQMIQKVDITDFPNIELKTLKNKSLSHGDLCLSNIIVNNNNIVGFLEMGNASIRDIQYDLNALIRSFEYYIEKNRNKNKDKIIRKLIETLSKYFDMNNYIK